MNSTEYSPIFEATRGNVVESVQLGAFAVLDDQNRVLASWGDINSITYLRSSAKPFQALPFIENGGDAQFGLDQNELAILCASHSGTDEHVNVISGMHKKLGLQESMLQCGTVTPSSQETWIEMIKRGEKPTPIRHMCSGKHTGMLGYGLLLHADLTNYLSNDNPVQKGILNAFSEMISWPEEQVNIGVDGCSAPTFAVPLRNAALGFARLCQPAGLNDKRAIACHKITSAMRNFPNMVAGPRKFDTVLMESTFHKVISKGGAEGYQCLGVMPDAIEPGSPGLGIAIKIADGDIDDRVRPLVSIEILRQLGAITSAEAVALQKFDRRRIFNAAKLDVGEFRTTFSIK